jgi:hypothetical protein
VNLLLVSKFQGQVEAGQIRIRKGASGSFDSISDDAARGELVDRRAMDRAADVDAEGMRGRCGKRRGRGERRGDRDGRAALVGPGCEIADHATDDEANRHKEDDVASM